jgi:hypothetical protein
MMSARRSAAIKRKRRKQIGQREKPGCDTVLMKTPAKPIESPETGTALQSCTKLRRQLGIFISLQIVRFPRKGALPGKRDLFSQAIV